MVGKKKPMVAKGLSRGDQKVDLSSTVFAIRVISEPMALSMMEIIAPMQSIVM